MAIPSSDAQARPWFVLILYENGELHLQLTTAFLHFLCAHVEITAGECSRLSICAERFAKNTPTNVVKQSAAQFLPRLSHARKLFDIFFQTAPNFWN
jgi:hypothetical protein